MNFKKSMLTAACAVALGAAAPAMATNWLMVQGTEKAGAAPRAKVWGFMQPEYQRDESDPNAAGQYIPPKLIGPELTSQQSFNIRRARIGVRGLAMPIDPKVNYFFLVEFGNNAITAPGDSFAKITDASVTFNHFKDRGARVRVGLFKTPMAEEIYQGIALFDYINFTWGTNQLLLERFPNRGRATQAPALPTDLPGDQSLQAFNRPVNAGRDTGIQLFNTHKLKNNWELGWSAMIGNGNGLSFIDVDNNKDKYLYVSLAKVFAGSGPRRQDMKFFAWGVSGKRTADLTFTDNEGGVAINDNGTPGDLTDDYPVVTGDGIDDTYDPKTYDRKRWGFGMKYLKKPFRFTAEYIKAEGMIFVGPDKPTFDMNTAAPMGNGENGKATAWYVEGAWYIPKTGWELDVRYDVLNRLEDDTPHPVNGRTFEIKFTNLTLGVQYHFNKKTRMAINYEIRDAEAIDWPAGAGPNGNLDGIGNRFGVQVTTIF